MTAAASIYGPVAFLVLLAVLIARQVLQLTDAPRRRVALLTVAAVPLSILFAAAVAIRLVPLVS